MDAVAGVELIMRIALASIRQRPLDIPTNSDRIKRCIREAIDLKADIWIGADYELIGYWPEPREIDEKFMEEVQLALADICKTFAESNITVYIRAPHGSHRNSTYCLQKGRMLVVPDCLVDNCILNQSPKSILSDLDDGLDCICTSILGTDGVSLVFSGQLSVKRGGKMICQSDSYSLKDYDIVIFSPDDPMMAIVGDKEPETIKIITSWMYDKLMVSKQTGFFVPLSGGIDSGLAAILVQRLQMRMKAELARDIPMNNLLLTAYIKGEHSTIRSQTLAKNLASHLNSTHIELGIKDVIKTLPNSSSRLAVQNATSRLRLVLSYYIAQSAGNYLVVGTGNRDEIMTGYYTKYDCSSGDIAPIADLSKLQVRKLVTELLVESNPELAHELIVQRSTAELAHGQFDEDELGMSYEDMDIYFNQLYDSQCSNHVYVTRFRQNYHKIKTLPVHCQCSRRSFADFNQKSSRGPC